MTPLPVSIAAAVASFLLLLIVFELIRSRRLRERYALLWLLTGAVLLALSVWRERPDVKKIRATFGAVSPPDISDFEHGKSESFQPMFSYDFSLRKEEKQ